MLWIDFSVAGEFLRLLHGTLDASADGHIKHMLLASARAAYPWLSGAAPGALPRYPFTVEGRDVLFSLATYKGRRRTKPEATAVSALWADLDWDRSVEHTRWLAAARGRLERCTVGPPSICVRSGAGLHAYWLLATPVRFLGGHADCLREQVQGVNNALAEILGGDRVGDVSRVLRLPGSIHPKHGRRAELLWAEGKRRYAFEDLASELGVLLCSATNCVRQSPPPSTSSSAVPQPAPAAAPAQKRGRGRPQLPITKRELRPLRPWARVLVVGGAWGAGSRYVRAGKVDRSRADLAAIGEMVRAGWPADKILKVYERSDWLIGVKFREIAVNGGIQRAHQYLVRGIERARAAHVPQP